MSRSGMKNQTHREGSFKFETEPEEGEIVEDYDLIVSSDEELNMRQRIRELEAENEEIEQIAVISRSYVDKINHQNNYLESCRAAQVPTDASSISSTEFVTPQKRKRGKSGEGRRKRCHRQHPREHHQYSETIRYDVQKVPPKSRSRKAHCKRRQKLFAKKHKKFQSDRFIHKESNTEILSLESLESSDSSPMESRDNCSNNFFATKRKNESFDKGKHITRDTLRLAVARNTSEYRLVSNKNCLKDKLMRQELVAQSSKAGTNEQYEFTEVCDIRVDNDEDDDVQVIENEPVIQTIDDDSTDSMEEKELRLIALKSAVLKKHMARKMRNATVAYSPTDFDEMLSSGVLQHDNQIDDIDVVDLEAEDSQIACVIVSPEASPQLTMLEDQEESQQMVDCKPVDMDIANSDSEDATVDSWTKDVDPSLHKYSMESFDFSKSIHYDFYMQKLNDLPPPPPGVDDYVNVPPPPPYHVFYNAESQSMDLDNEDLIEDQQKTAAESGKQTNTFNKLTLPIKEGSVNEEEEDEEEEEALRALLLSKFQSPKSQKKIRNLKEINEYNEKPHTKISEQPIQSHCKTKPTEIILKEAVKRLKIHSQPEAYKEKASTDFYVEEKSRKVNEPQDYPTISTDNIFEKLRDRVNIYNNMSQLNSEQSGCIDDKTPFEPKELGTKPYVSVGKDHAFVSSNIEMRSMIDESEITRRLQEIRENVFNSTYKRTSIDEQTSLVSVPKVIEVSQSYYDIIENAENNNQSAEQSFFQPKCLLVNNLVNISPKNMDLNPSLTRNKTVKSNFDVTTNQTTFKVTINNNVTFKPEEKVLSHKENNTNVPKNIPLKINGNTCKVTDRLAKITNKTIESNGDNNAQLKRTQSVFKPIVKDNVVAKPSHSVIRTTKIVKPNKIINTNFGSKPKEILKTTMTAKPSKLEMNSKLLNVPDNSRLITSIDQVKYMCKVAPFIISLQNSSNESSEDEFGADYNSLYQPLYDYNDNASPLSLNLESPSITPLRSNSPTDTYTDYCVQNTNIEAVNLKAKITPIPKEKTVESRAPQTIPNDQGDKINKTPLAVRHLPAAAQNEYRRLVHRMKLLENKRKLGNIEESEMEGITTDKTDKSSSITDAATKEKFKTDSTNSAPKSSLVKTVLLRNASNNTTPTDIISNDTSQSKKSCCSSKLDKSNVLRSYENLYIKFGAGIVNHLDKSIKLVEDAKKAKIAKLKLENRLKELKIEMEVLQGKHKEEQQKISCIYPIICTTNEVITSLKQKRSKVYKAALNLGKTLKGEDYRLNSDLKGIITSKSKKLATDIKNVNSLKAQNIKNMEEDQNPNSTEEQHTGNEKKNMENYNAKSNGNILVSKVNENSTPDKPVVCSISCKEGEEKNNLELLVKNEFGGNTEFQNMEINDSKALDNPTDFCDPNKNTKLNNECSEEDTKQTVSLSSYISPLEHLRNIDSNVDPNGVVCPYDLMGNCEDVACKYVHITPKAKT